jgi:hypothetical protein
MLVTVEKQVERDFSIQWHWYGKNKHAIVVMEDNEFIEAIPVSKKTADRLVANGWNYGG